MANKFTYRIITRIYDECKWKRGDLDGLRVTVTGPGGTVHVLHERRLATYRKSLETMLLTHMPDRLMRTKGCKGLPWYAMRWDKLGQPLGSNEHVEKLLALTVGAGLVELTHRRVEGVEDITAYVIVEDGKVYLKTALDDKIVSLSITLPCLISTEGEINTPRLPSYRIKRELREDMVRFLTFADFEDQDDDHYGLTGSATQVERIFSPSKNTQQQVLAGSSEEQSQAIFRLLQDKKML